MVPKKSVRKDTPSTLLDHVINSSITNMVYSATCSKNESEHISQHYKDQNTVIQSLQCITDVEQEEKDTEASRY
jgi:hypothetical protein